MRNLYLWGTLMLLISTVSKGQNNEISQSDLVGSNNPIEYTASFLTIAPDSRAGAMGDAGVATSPDYNSMHWNPAKYAFVENDMGFAASYTPWLRNLVNDINLGYLSFYKRIDKVQTFAATMLYFDLGDIQFTNDLGQYNGQHSPYELSIDVAYARSFSDRISGGVAFRYIRSDITGGALVGDMETKAGNAVAADISMYYVNDDLKLYDNNATWSAGINISNIGSKLSYTELEKDFLPTNLKIGTALKYDIDEYNSFTLALDLNKFLVPTPEYELNDSILFGKNSDVSVAEGMIQSFYDAPGGWEEEINEIKYNIGAEYWYANQFAVRAGYFHEHENKGNRKYFTVGAGLRLNVFTIDFSYLIPIKQNNPLANTIRFTLALDFQALQEQQNN
ncbi:MAG TPA: type IX secretion system outer membrane channel protein PorV [Bacteroidales bacterium]|nr:type IX secretion system outer membrane channel protein PorV [Bacteroidales bacterium]